jgi:hypothetical protein
LPPASLSLRAETLRAETLRAETLRAETLRAETLRVEGTAEPPGLAELKARLNPSDRWTAVRALQLALTELGDGMTLEWRRPARELAGRVKPVSAFRDGQGRLCRHVVYWLALGRYERRVEGIGCREDDGSWSLSG